ncbi:hypothetical protein ACXWR7_10925, partial [Streptococcus pyogenes]
MVNLPSPFSPSPSSLPLLSPPLFFFPSPFPPSFLFLFFPPPPLSLSPPSSFLFSFLLLATGRLLLSTLPHFYLLSHLLISFLHL